MEKEVLVDRAQEQKQRHIPWRAAVQHPDAAALSPSPRTV